MRLYRTNCTLSSDDGPCVEMKLSGGGRVAVAVGHDVAEALDELQREWWRIERREARHTLSLDAMLPHVLADPSSSPEGMLMGRSESRALARAVAALSPVQMRRILMHGVALLPIREIAEREGCSERAVKYSLHRARKRLREILGSDFPS